jgi:hypothetical protein
LPEAPHTTYRISMSRYRATLVRQDNQTSERTSSQISRMMRYRHSSLVCPARGGILRAGQWGTRHARRWRTPHCKARPPSGLKFGIRRLSNALVLSRGRSCGICCDFAAAMRQDITSSSVGRAIAPIDSRVLSLTTLSLAGCTPAILRCEPRSCAGVLF